MPQPIREDEHMPAAVSESRNALLRALGECSRIEQRSEQAIIAELLLRFTHTETAPGALPSFEEESRGLDEEERILRSLFAGR